LASGRAFAVAAVIRSRHHALVGPQPTIESKRPPTQLYALTDIVLLDIGLPPRARFYAITGRSEAEVRSRISDAGFHGYFLKPLDFSVIERVLQQDP
jgi:hypothetical protein